MSGNSNQEADALFATKRKKQQEEQAEQDRQAEILRKKAEMEAEINRLAEETERQRIAQEEAKQAALKAEDEAQKAAQGAAQRAAKIAEKTSQVTEKGSLAAAGKEKPASKESGVSVKLMAIIGGAAAGVILLVVILAAALSSGGNSKIFQAKLSESITVKESNYTVNYPSAYFAEDNLDGSVSFEYGKPGDAEYTCIVVEGMTSAYYQEATGQGDPDIACRNILSSVMSNFSPTFETYNFVSEDGYTVYSSSFMMGDALDLGFDLPMAGMILNANDMYYFAIYATAIEGAEEDLENLTAAILNDINK